MLGGFFIRIFSIVGRKNTGKTLLSVRLIEKLKKRNYKVATIKHTHHVIEVDKENSDTWKHRIAGSDIVVGVGDKTFFNIDRVYSLDRLLFLIKLIENPDFVMIEGFKNYNYLKVSTSKDLVDEFTIKVIDPFKIDEDGINSLVNDIENLSFDIIDTLYTNECGYNDVLDIGRSIIKGELDYNPDDLDVSVAIDENNIGLNFFVKDFIKNTIIGMLKTLKTEEFGVKNFNKLEVIVNKKEE
ncbi:MAG: molybdopterin-guanine dinucleotide biosynthesis protein B [Methanobrevibacter sp.]|jgi:molybdopterin-guanine dinucleotide biosynthesis protein B|nr:molybdopterin-guanine dinucleotide biosynthesis protein B [Candidatus Methanovirga aequatorialis]